jgi:hypothetical protein
MPTTLPPAVTDWLDGLIAAGHGASAAAYFQGSSLHRVGHEG